MLTEDMDFAIFNELDSSGANWQPNGNFIETNPLQLEDNFQSSGSFSTPELEEIIATNGTKEMEFQWQFPESDLTGNFNSNSAYQWNHGDPLTGNFNSAYQWNHGDPFTGNKAIDSDSTDSTKRDVFTDSEAVLEASVFEARNQLEIFANGEDFFNELNQAFELDVSSTEAKAVIEDLASGETMPELEIVSASELDNANAAFGEETIYISEEFLSDNSDSPDAVEGVLLEEIGHFVDGKLSDNDSPGDEGDIFAQVVQDENLSEAELTTSKAEDDSATLDLDGEEINVELSESLTPYTIESGDTLSQIARDELGDGTLWTTIEREDGTTYSEAEAQQIQPGQVVYLPGSNEKPPTPYTIESGDTLSQIARDELGDGTLWTTIEREDGTTYSEAEAQQIQPGQVVYLPGSNEKPPTPYTIESGDTLSQIARDELGDGTLWTTIEREDGTTYSEAEAQQIQPGQVVYLPSEISGGEQPEPSLPDELAGNFKEEIVTIASQQWEFFDRGNLKETEENAWQRVVEYWETPDVKNPLEVDTPEEVGDGNNAWSAAFISWVMHEGGVRDEFDGSLRHSDYINDAIQAKENNDSDSAFFGYRLNEYSPQIGDLVGYARQDGVNYDTATKTGNYKSHTDIVVDVREGEIDVIGGNVSESVTKKTLEIDSEGRLIDDSEDWFVVLSNQLDSPNEEDEASPANPEPAPMSTPYDATEIINSPAVDLNLKKSAEESVPLILSEAEESRVTDPRQIAYILATADHESGLGKNMEEFASGEAYQGRLGNDQPGDGVKYKGRGYVQLTGKTNYEYWSDKLGIDLVDNPELAADPDNAARILVEGMRDGSFTGVGLSEYINGESQDFYNARQIVNGIDPAIAQDIADDAERYYEVLTT